MAVIRRGKIKSINNAGKSKVVVVVGDDSEENLVNTVDVSIPTVEGQPVPSPNNMTLPLKTTNPNGNKRFVFSDLNFSEDAVGYSYSMTSVMKDINNKQVGEALTTTIEVESDGDAKAKSVRIIQIDESNFKLKVVVVGDSENDVASVDVVFSDYSGPEPIPTEMTLTDPVVNEGKKVFKNKTLTFDDPSAAVGETYVAIVDLKDASENSINSTEFNITVEGSAEA